MIEIESAIDSDFELLAAFDRIAHPALGRRLGGQGESGAVLLASGERLRGKGTQIIRAGERLIIHTPGGGGYGDPKARDREQVRSDVANELFSAEAFAVGTALTGDPPHRSQRALLTHWAPTSGHDAQSLFGVRVQNTNRWKPAVGQTVHALPGHPVSLAPLP